MRTHRASRLLMILCSAACSFHGVRVAYGADAIAHQNYLWRSVALGGGGYITGFDADNQGKTRVARTDVHGAYIWSADKNRWVQLVTSASMPAPFRVQGGVDEGVYEVVVAPSRPDRIYLATKGRVFRSDNRGLDFVDTTKTDPFPVVFDANSEFRTYGPFLTVDPENPDLVLLGTPNNGLWRSTDGGDVWVPVRSVPFAKAFRPHGSQKSPGISSWFEMAEGRSTGRIWAMSPGNGIYVSRDRGETFAPLSSQTSVQPLIITQGDFTSDGTFFGVDTETKSVWEFNNGSWSNLTMSGALPPLPYGAIAIHPKTSEIFVFAQGGAIYSSSNEGKSWHSFFHTARVGAGDPPWLPAGGGYFCVSRAHFDPGDQNRLWMGSGTGVFYADLPKYLPWVEWISETRGIEELVAQDVAALRPDAILFAVLDFGIFKKEALNEFPSSRALTNRFMAAQQLTASAANPNFAATNASDTNSCCSEDGNSILAGFSVDGGMNWKKFATLPTPPGTSEQDPWRMSFGSIAASNADPNNIVWEPAFWRAPYFTKDMGRTWARVSFNGENLPLTGAHGDKWLPRKDLAADPVRAGEFYLAHGGNPDNPQLSGLWRTQDGGEHWYKLYDGEIAPSSQYAAKLKAMPGREGELFFTSAQKNGPDTRLRRSSDGGRTWHSLDEVDNVDDVAFGRPAPGSPQPTVFISGRVKGAYGIWRSDDDAHTWLKIASFPMGRLDRVQVLSGDPNIYGRVYIGYAGSGFTYGEPSRCAVAPYVFSAQEECVPVE